jgi:hypothetical protein
MSFEAIRLRAHVSSPSVARLAVLALAAVAVTAA